MRIRQRYPLLLQPHFQRPELVVVVITLVCAFVVVVRHLPGFLMSSPPAPAQQGAQDEAGGKSGKEACGRILPHERLRRSNFMRLITAPLIPGSDAAVTDARVVAASGLKS